MSTCCFLEDLLLTNCPGPASQWNFRNNPVSLQKGPEEAGSQDEGVTWCLHGARGRHWDSVMWSKPQARGWPRPRLDNTTLHEEESLSSQELGISTWGGFRTGSRLSGWEEAGEEAETERVVRVAAPGIEAQLFKLLSTTNELLLRIATSKTGELLWLESGEQPAGRHHLLLNICADPQLPRRSLWENV